MILAGQGGRGYFVTASPAPLHDAAMAIELVERAIEAAVDTIGVKEVGGRNCGPEVEEYLRSVDLPAGEPWCMAWVVAMFDRAAEKLGVLNPLARTGKVSRFWLRSPRALKSLTPARGAIFVHLHDPNDAESDGHCGLVVLVGQERMLTLEGNTNMEGSREGDSVRARIRPIDGYVNVGYVDLSLTWVSK